MKVKDIDAIATTVKPGLPMSLMIGTNFGKYLSKIGNKPFIPIHHMEAHALTVRMVEKVAKQCFPFEIAEKQFFQTIFFLFQIDFPFLVLLISGGHCLIAIAQSVDKFLTLGSSIDDAPGEAFDKVSRTIFLLFSVILRGTNHSYVRLFVDRSETEVAKYSRILWTVGRSGDGDGRQSS